MTINLDPNQVQKLFEEAVSAGAAPGFQFCAFDKDHLIVNGVTGYATLPNEEEPSGRLMRLEDPHWLASGGKIAASIVVLAILDGKLAFNGMAMEELDSHEKLIEVLPEFDHDAEDRSVVTKILMGFKGEVDASGKRIPIYRDSTVKMTLRMLLNHTSGFRYPFTDTLIREWLKGIPLAQVTAKIEHFTTPLSAEPGTAVGYGHSTDWLSVFATRATGKNLRRLFKELIFEPLGMPAEECDGARTAVIAKSQPTNYANPMTGSGYVPFPFEIYSEEGDPPQGHVHFASGPIWSSTQTYSKLLQAVLRRDIRVMSEEAWIMATRNDIEGTSAVMPKPRWRSAFPAISYDLQQLRAPRDPDNGVGISLLQCEVAIGLSLTGWPSGTISWGGLTNVYYALDPVNGVGYMMSCQVMPFYHPKIVKLRDDFERLIHDSLNAPKGNSLGPENM